MGPDATTTGLAVDAAGALPPEPDDAPAPFSCQECGACCAYSAEWPRFSTETDAELDLIPAAHVAADQSGMRCENNRCTALKGEIGKATACSVYAVRPEVCRVCLPGDPECLMARRSHGLPC